MNQFDIELDRLIYIEERMNMIMFKGESFKHSDEFNNEEAERLANKVLEKKFLEKAENYASDKIWMKLLS